jgi:FHA domain
MPVCPAGHDSATSDYCDTCGAKMAGAAPAPPPPAPSAPSAPSAPPAGGCPVCQGARTGRFCEECGYDFATGTGGVLSTTPVPVTPTPYPSPATAPPAGTPQPGSPYAGAPSAGTPSAGAANAGTSYQGTPSAGTPSAGAPHAGTPHTGAPSAGAPSAPSAWFAVVAADRAYFDMMTADDPDSAAVTFPPYCPERTLPLTGGQIRIGRRSVSSGVVPEIDLAEPPADPGISHLHAVLLAGPNGGWQLVDPGSTNGTMVNNGTAPIELNVAVPLTDGDRIHVGAWTTITLRRSPS